MINRRTLIILASNLLLVTLAQVANHALTGTGIHLLIYGILVVFPVINLPYGQGLLVVVLTGLWIDAGSAAGFGLFLMLLAALQLAAGRVQLKLHRENPGHRLALALGGNTALFFVLVPVFGLSQGFSTTYLLRVGVDFLASNLVILVIGGWFFDFQHALLSLVGINIYEEELENA